MVTSPPWYHRPARLSSGSSIAVIGAGIAGLLSAYTLNKQGFKVTIIERSADIMGGASGNPAAILDPFLTARPSLEGRIYLAAYLRAVSFYKEREEGVFKTTGLLKKALNEKQSQRFQKIAKALPIDITRLEGDNLFFPASGIIAPHLLGAELSRGIDCLFKTNVRNIQKQDGWVLYAEGGQEILKTDGVVLCTAHELGQFCETSSLSLMPVRGQISYVAPDPSQKTIFCSEGYLTPDVSGFRVAGATFGKGDTSLEIRECEHREILEKCALPPDTKITGGRVALRAMTADHLPLVGAVPDMNWSEKAYRHLHHGPAHEKFPPARYHDGLYVFAGLGARGFLSAPLLSEVLAGLISGTKLPLEEDLATALHPGRFLVRKLSQKPF